MAGIKTVSELYREIMKEVTSGPERWMEFLQLAGRLHKYGFDEQLLIYGQRPDAVACASMDLWNKTMRRWIKAGSKSIALLDDEPHNRTGVKYIFDYADTRPLEGAKKPWLWQITENNRDVVLGHLKEKYGELSGDDFDNQLFSTVERLVDASMNDYIDTLPSPENSYMEELDAFNIEVINKRMLLSSVQYLVLSRCGVDTSPYFSVDDFRDIYNFNNMETLVHLGNAVNQISGSMLLEVRQSIKNQEILKLTLAKAKEIDYNKEKINDLKRESEGGVNESELQSGGGLSQSLSDSGSGTPREHNADRQVRNPAQESSGENKPGTAHDYENGREPAHLPVGNQPGSNGTGGKLDRDTGESGGRERGPESPGRHGVGTSDEQHHIQSGGDRPPGDHLRIVSEAEQIEEFEKAADEKSAAFVLQQNRTIGDIVNQHFRELVRAAFSDPEYNKCCRELSDKRTAKKVLAKALDKAVKEIASQDEQLYSIYKDIEIKSRIVNDVFQQTYLSLETETKKINRIFNRKKRATIQEKNYKSLYNLAADVIEGKTDYMRYSAGKSFDPLSIERIGKNEISIMHWFMQNGDFMRDPDITVRYDIEKHTLEPLTFENSGMGIYQKVYEDETHWRPKLSKDLSDFLAQWFKNIKQHGYELVIEPEQEAAPEPEQIDSDGEIIKKLDPADFIPVGAVLEIESKRYQVESVDFSDGRVDLLDISNKSIVYEAHRHEPIEYIRRLYEEQRLSPVNFKLIAKEELLLEPEQEAATSTPKASQVPTDKPPVVRPPIIPELDEPNQVSFFQFAQNEHLEVEQPPPIEDSLVSHAGNFKITNMTLGVGGAKSKYQNNVTAIRLLKQIEAEDRYATPEEQAVLSEYVGWGGLSQAFDKRNQSWEKEYKELVDLLTPEEYESARTSTLNAHYTSPVVIQAMYAALLKMDVKINNILEPSMGVGNFFGLLPDELKKAQMFGVELDDVSGRIARKLYPSADIKIQGYQQSQYQDNSFDVVIGNVPFGRYQVADQRYDKHSFLLHDYFIAKSIDKVRVGGVIAVITSSGTMDKQSPTVRRYIAQRADLLGSIRLPNTAFKGNAGTEVTTDILFLQKRDRPTVEEPDWVHLGATEDGVPVNSYYASHPKMVLGKMVFDKSMYGNEKETACHPEPGADLQTQLYEAIQNISPAAVLEYTEIDMVEEVANTIPADPNVRNYSFCVVDDLLYYRVDSQMYPRHAIPVLDTRIEAYIKLRDCTRRIIDLQMDKCSDEDLQQAQAQLDSLYNSFSQKYGLINSRYNRTNLGEDSSYCLLCSLEILDEENNLERKADFFTKRTIKQEMKISSVATASEALAVSLNQRGCVDIGFMGSLLGGSSKIENMVAELQEQKQIFKNPMLGVANDPLVGWETADEYLSGEVVEKFEIAEAYAETNSIFDINVKALREVQPVPLSAADIDISLGASWVEPEIFEQFMMDVLHPPEMYKAKMSLTYMSAAGEWVIKGRNSVGADDITSNMTFGTKRRNAYWLLQDCLNMRMTRVYDVKIEDGKEVRKINPKETQLAQLKQEEIKQAFKEWVYEDTKRRCHLENKYNSLFNTTKCREFNGNYLTFPGMNPEISLRPHQKNAVARILYGKNNSLLAHVVGAGKTYEMIAATMKMKQLGKAQKSLIVVPNYLTEQWASDFLKLYPGANILVASDRDFDRDRRKIFCSRIATGYYDGIIIGHSQFEKIPVSEERQAQNIKLQLREITSAIAAAEDNESPRYTVKKLEKTKISLQARLERLNDSSKKDDVITFEELGIDHLFIDESHNYKNLFLYSKMRNVGGLPQNNVKKSSDMLMKCQYMDDLTGGTGITYASGTPISNSITELFTVMRYLYSSYLYKKGWHFFDEWASIFADPTAENELAPDGSGLRVKTRLARFKNLPELVNIFHQFADVQTRDMLPNLNIPKYEVVDIITKPTKEQAEIIPSFVTRADAIRNNMVEPTVDNMLKITNDGRKLALDQRLYDSSLPDDPGSKVNACVKNVYEIWQDTKAQKSTQLIFSDLSTPTAGGWSVYQDIKDKLIAKGVPESEIAFIHDATSKVQKFKLFMQMRSGKVRVLIGSTAKMGAGMNVQKRLCALHHLDVPWRPSDIEQREGRILRQGNDNKSVKIYRYITENTFDAYSWQVLEQKQRYISQIMTGKNPARTCEDIDPTALTYAEVKSLATGDPRIRERMELEIEVQKLNIYKAAYDRNKFKLEDDINKYLPTDIAELKNQMRQIRADMAETKNLYGYGEFLMAVNGSTYKGDKQKKLAGFAILQEAKQIKGTRQIYIGSYCGLTMRLYENWGNVYLVLGEHYETELSEDPHGCITKINNLIEGLPQRLQARQNELEEKMRLLESSKNERQKPFKYAEDYKQKKARLIELNNELSVDVGLTNCETTEEDIVDDMRMNIA